MAGFSTGILGGNTSSSMFGSTARKKSPLAGTVGGSNITGMNPSMPAYQTGFGAKGNPTYRPKTAEEIANEQAQANIGATHYGSQANVSGFVRSDDGNNKVTQRAYEDQALAQLRAQHDMAALTSQQQYGSQEAGAGRAHDLARMDKQAALAKEAEARRTALFHSLAGKIHGIHGGPGGGPDPNEQAARDAAFAREKDRIGQIGRGALDSLTNLYSERGVSGGGYEQAGIADLLGNVQGGLGDVAREQTLQDLGRAQQVGDRNYAGAITQRGQNMNYLQSLMGLLNAGGLY